MSHTPGPWRYGGIAGKHTGRVLAGPTTKGEPLGIKRVAVVVQDPVVSGGHPLANGLLIAAAPELLESCKAMLAAIAKHYPNDWSGLKFQATASIARAEGKPEGATP